MRVLVTGGLGFLGRAVVMELERHNHDVLILSHTAPVTSPSRTPIIRADLRDGAGLTAALAAYEIEGVCHLAGLTSIRDSFADPIGYFETNLVGTANLLRALPESVRLAMTSTSAVYGSAHSGELGEDLPPTPENPYAASKLAAEQLLAYTAATGLIGSVVCRCFNIAGAIGDYGDADPTRIIPAALRAALGEIPHVTVNGDGSALREFTHVLDVALGVRLALEAAQTGKHQTFNIGTGDGVRMIDIVRIAQTVTGRDIKVVHRPAAQEAHSLISNPRKIMESLGWRPSRSSIHQILTDAWNAKCRPRRTPNG